MESYIRESIEVICTDIWLRPNCETCGGLGAAIERRTVGDVMVCENGHEWISPVAGKALEEALEEAEHARAHQGNPR